VLGALGLGFYFCDTESRLLHRFRRLGLRKKPLLMLILILWPLRMQCLLVEIRLVLKLSLGHQTGVILGARFSGLRSLRMKIYIILLRWMWPRRSPCRNLKCAKCLLPQLGRWPKSTASERWC
jgi:hypothetical protein